MTNDTASTPSVGDYQQSPAKSTESVNVTFAPGPPPHEDLHKFVTEVSKFSLLCIFVFYSIGFIIWHAYLGTYGVASMGFLESEYLSASFCFMFILAGFALPPALVVRRLS